MNNTKQPPSLRQSEIFNVDILGKSYQYTAWSNSDVLEYASIKEQIDTKVQQGIINPEVSKYAYEQNIFEKLVFPNLNNINEDDLPKSSYTKTILFLEMYAVSRGTTIEVLYECPSCFDKEKQNYSSFQFDLTTDVSLKNHESSRDGDTFDINVNLANDNVKITFELGNSNYDLHKEILDQIETITRSEASRLAYKYIFSWIKSMTISDEKYYLPNVVDYCLNNLSEEEFKETMLNIVRRMPTINYIKEDIVCEQCNHKSNFESESLPDFSLVGVSQ